GREERAAPVRLHGARRGAVLRPGKGVSPHGSPPADGQPDRPEGHRHVAGRERRSGRSWVDGEGQRALLRGQADAGSGQGDPVLAAGYRSSSSPATTTATPSTRGAITHANPSRRRAGPSGPILV